MNDYFFAEADVCKCCILNDYEVFILVLRNMAFQRVGPTSIQVKIYDGEHLKLSEVPGPLLRKVFEKVSRFPDEKPWAHRIWVMTICVYMIYISVIYWLYLGYFSTN